MPRVNNKDFYVSAINMHGTTAKGLNWHSKRTQIIRFDVLLEMLPEDISDFCIVDAGCGFADLYLHMQKKNKIPKEYIGIDTLDDMYEIASQRTGCEILTADICKDKLPSAEYYVCSGALNILNKFETYQFIQNCYSTCGKGFIFNMLHGSKDSQTYNYFNTKQIELIAKELNVKEIRMKKDYLDNDISIAFLKETD